MAVVSRVIRLWCWLRLLLLLPAVRLRAAGFLSGLLDLIYYCIWVDLVVQADFILNVTMVLIF